MTHAAADTDAPVRILAVAGSLRRGSLNARVVEAAARLAGTRDGVEVVVFDGLGPVEPFDEDVEIEGMPPGAAAFDRAVRSADGLFIATPEYNGSVPGQLKNALDWASRATSAPFKDLPRSAAFGKPVAVVSASTGQFGGVWSRDELAKVLRTQGARPLTEPSVTVAAADGAFDADGRIRSETTADRLDALLDALLDQVAALRAAGVVPERV